MSTHSVVNKERFPVKAIGMGTAPGNYPGEFTVSVVRFIEKIFSGFGLQPNDQRVLHLFSGASVLGGVRVDLDHHNATENADVFEWIANDKQVWQVALLDPPYALSETKIKKIDYSGWKPLSTSVPNRRMFASWAREHAVRLLWLDACAPKPDGFRREALWLILPGGYHRVRVLSLLTNKNLQEE